MRKKQKYTKTDMYASISKWHESGLSQLRYCKQEQVATSTFSYWVRKYKHEQLPTEVSKLPAKSFIPLELTKPDILPVWLVEIAYPNGVHVRCAAGADVNMIKTLIGCTRRPFHRSPAGNKTLSHKPVDKTFNAGFIFWRELVNFGGGGT